MPVQRLPRYVLLLEVSISRLCSYYCLVGITNERQSAGFVTPAIMCNV